MKKQIIIAVGLLALFSCTKKSTSSSPTSSTGDSTFNGSYLSLTFNGKTFYEKDVVYKPDGAHLVQITTLTSSTTISGVNSNTLALSVVDNFGIYGLKDFIFYTALYSSSYSSLGTFQTWNANNQITQANPLVGYSDTSGSITITYNGSDYIQGTINTTLYANGFTYPATGSFKIYH